MSKAAATSPQEHFEHLRELWLEVFTQMRFYIHNLDGDTSRAIGRIVIDTIEGDSDWPSVAAAKYLKNDPDLWHELANNRKK